MLLDITLITNYLLNFTLFGMLLGVTFITKCL